MLRPTDPRSRLYHRGRSGARRGGRRLVFRGGTVPLCHYVTVRVCGGRDPFSRETIIAGVGGIGRLVNWWSVGLGIEGRGLGERRTVVPPGAWRRGWRGLGIGGLLSAWSLEARAMGTGLRWAVVRLEPGRGGRFGCSFTAPSLLLRCSFAALWTRLWTRFWTSLAMNIGLRAMAGVVRSMEGSLSATKANPPRSIIAQKFELVTRLQEF
jgi:hypothetical protein